LVAEPTFHVMTRERAFRIASALYRRSLRRVERSLPANSLDDAVQVFNDLQRDAAQRGGWRGLARCWVAEVFAVRTLRQSMPPQAPESQADHGQSGAIIAFLGHDLRDAWRSLRRAPGYSVLVAATLALGIGVNTALFSVVDALLFKTLPYADADRLMVVSEVHPRGTRVTVAPANFLDWQTAAHSFTHLEARLDRRYALLDGGDPFDVRGAEVSIGYFDMLGVRAEVGRTFTAADAQSDAPCAAVISHRLWAGRFSSNAQVLGQPVHFSGQVCTLIGVLPAGSVFDHGGRDVYSSLTFHSGPPTRLSHLLTVVGRLAPGVSAETARQEMKVLALSINTAHPEVLRGWSATADPMRDLLVRADARQLMLVLFAAVGLVLLVACVNVAGLTVSRTVARHGEVAIRMALGAGRWRVFRYFLVENLALSMLGGLAGLVIGRWSLTAFVALLPPGALPAEVMASLDARALIFTSTIALLTGVMSGTLPAWHAARSGVAHGLRSGGRSVSGSALTARVHAALLVAEVALAMVLVVGATLLAVSFTRLTRVKPGFDPTDVTTLHLSLPATRYKTEAEWAITFERMLAQIRRIPRVESAAAVTSLPLGGWLYGEIFRVEGLSSDPARPTSAHLQHVSAGYFETFHIPIVAGRSFTTRDDGQAPPVAIVNQTFARQYLTGGPALGRSLRLGVSPTPWEIVGVSRDVKTYGLDDPDWKTPEIYVSHLQQPINAMFLAVRTAPDAGAPVVPEIRAALRAIDPELPAANILSMNERIGSSVTTQRFRTLMFVGFAMLSGLLAALGVYATRSQAVATRLREVGIRLALGAARGHVLGLVLGQSLRLVAVGLVIGLIVSVGLAPNIEQWLFHTSTTDPIIMVGPVLLLGSAALLASWLPARRAARADPVKMLHQD
jgi:predicted permease